MAKKAKVEERTDIKVTSEKDLDEAFKIIKTLNPDSDRLSESPLSEVKNWISTDCYALNAIMSGSVYKGVPTGRTTTFYGLQSTGKTLIINKILANAQKMGYNRTVYFDSENALDKAVLERVGGDPEQVIHAPVETVEECKMQCIQLLTRLIEMGAKSKVVVVIDSLGNLSTMKEFEDVAKNHDASDMGQKAKALSSLGRMLTYRAARIDAPVLCTNHIMENPNDRYPSLIKKQNGGLKFLYTASLLVQLSVIMNKTEDEKDPVASLLSDRVSGVTISALTAKNRFVPPFIKAENIYVNFKTGLSKYKGLVDLATRYAIIEKDGHAYKMVGGEKIGYASTFEDNAEFWENGPLQKLDVALQKDLTYSNEKYEHLKKEVDELESENDNENT